MRKNDKQLEQLQIGDYVSFHRSNIMLYKVVGIKKKTKNPKILVVEAYNREAIWVDLEYVTSIFKISKEIEITRNKKKIGDMTIRESMNRRYREKEEHLITHSLICDFSVDDYDTPMFEIFKRLYKELPSRIEKILNMEV